MNHYCTLFDSNYLTRGLALYSSLVNTGEKFILYIFAFDDLSKKILTILNLEFVEVVSLHQFESEALLSVKKTRGKGEYCWTCTAFTIKYVLDNYDVEEVTYLDSDLYFFSKPDVLLQEFRASNNDVMITKHRYTPEYDQSDASGIYCVQFMVFRNTINSLRILDWWKDRCLEWCYARVEEGKFGDQKYLDDWTKRFERVYVLKNIGGGVAPWNIQQYICSDGPQINGEDIVFYHFHGLSWKSDNRFDLGQYKLSKSVMENIYEQYIVALKLALLLVQEKYSEEFTKGIIEEKVNFSFATFKEIMRRKLRGNYNVIQR